MPKDSVYTELLSKPWDVGGHGVLTCGWYSHIKHFKTNAVFLKKCVPGESYACLKEYFEMYLVPRMALA